MIGMHLEFPQLRYTLKINFLDKQSIILF